MLTRARRAAVGVCVVLLVPRIMAAPPLHPRFEPGSPKSLRRRLQAERDRSESVHVDDLLEQWLRRRRNALLRCRPATARDGASGDRDGIGIPARSVARRRTRHLRTEVCAENGCHVHIGSQRTDYRRCSPLTPADRDAGATNFRSQVSQAVFRSSIVARA